MAVATHKWLVVRLVVVFRCYPNKPEKRKASCKVAQGLPLRNHKRSMSNIMACVFRDAASSIPYRGNELLAMCMSRRWAWLPC